MQKTNVAAIECGVVMNAIDKGNHVLEFASSTYDGEKPFRLPWDAVPGKSSWMPKTSHWKWTRQNFAESRMREDFETHLDAIRRRHHPPDPDES